MNKISKLRMIRHVPRNALGSAPSTAVPLQCVYVFQCDSVCMCVLYVVYDTSMRVCVCEIQTHKMHYGY